MFKEHVRDGLPSMFRQSSTNKEEWYKLFNIIKGVKYGRGRDGRVN